MTQKKEWFSEWFDSAYYHILYKHRDHREAEAFIDRLLAELKAPLNSSFLDLACGKGRHAQHIYTKGYTVEGWDISPESIRHANQQYENKGLTFRVHDMRKEFPVGSFDYILNLFTSFAYFETKEEEQLVLQHVFHALKPGGFFLVDFLNTPKVIKDLIAEEQKSVEGITFDLKRRVEDGRIIKSIDFEDRNKQFHFEERVRAIQKEEFLSYFDTCGFKMVQIWGNYKLEPYDSMESDRMIFLLQRTIA